MVTLQPMTKREFEHYMRYAIEDYAKDKVAAGNWHEDEALALSKATYERLLPDNEKTDNHYLMSVFHEELVVGMIWIAQQAPENPSAGYIYDFVIFEQYQGQGYGKQTMKEVEVLAKELGITQIGLNVFGHNDIARSLYEKMGYEITNITMVKKI